jgi:6-phosphogluconolactonase
MTVVRTFGSAEELAWEAAVYVAGRLNAALAERARASLALSGGTTPLLMNRALASQSLPWERLDFYQADERAVPPDHPESNYAGASQSLFSLLPTTPKVYRMPAELPDLDAAARAYEAQLPERLDVIVLGLGDDGHTCSLFPGRRAVSERERRVLPVVDSPKPPSRRLTLTAPVLEQARDLFMLVTGAAKAEAVCRSLEEGPVREVPGRLARRGTWYLDRAAAELLGGGHSG